MKYWIAIEPGDEHTAFGVNFPDLPGCISAGNTYTEALEQAQEAALLWLEDAFAGRKPIPQPMSLQQASLPIPNGAFGRGRKSTCRFRRKLVLPNPSLGNIKPNLLPLLRLYYETKSSCFALEVGVYLHLDGNTYYASCERVFQPALNHNPVVILSNNDGSIVTLTKEAKALGLKRGTPLFKIKDIVEKHQVHVLSSNYELYGDMSRRMMDTVKTRVPRIEIYSIDECCADVAGMENLTDFGRKTAPGCSNG